MVWRWTVSYTHLDVYKRQQTYRPQNNATLIEKFIEEILDKKNIKGILRDTFDYENKIWLSLIHI